MRVQGTYAGLSLLCAVGLPSVAGEWPQFRGPNHDGISTDRIVKQWPTNGPPVLWRVPLNNGFSGFAVSGGRAFTLVSRFIGGVTQEVCLALNANSGTELWATPLGPASYPDGGAGSGDGPRSTPSVDGARVYTLSSYISLACLNVTNGQAFWVKDLRQDHGGSVITYQNGASPLIDGDLIYLNCNNAANAQALLALRKTDGSLAWKGQTNQMTHATPVVATIGGTRQVLFFTQPGLISANPSTGSVLWRYAFPYSVSSGASPVVAGDIVMCTAAYAPTGAGAVRLTNNGPTFTATQIWRTNATTLGAQWCTPVCKDGYLYGLFGLHGSTVYVKCAELSTGTIKWSRMALGSTIYAGLGNLMLVDGVLLILYASGELALVETNPANYVELARAPLLSGKCWNPLAVSDGRIYARTTTEGVALDVSLPPLKLLAPLRQTNGALQLLVGTATGAAVASNRLAGMEVRATTNLSLNVTQWAALTNRLMLSNGTVRMDSMDARALPRRFFIVNERP